MQQTLDKSDHTQIDPEFDNLTNFPNRLVLISLGDGKYAANNATLEGPIDEITVNGIACFMNAEEAIIYQEDTGITNGELVLKSFTEAREIALSKEGIGALFLMQGTHIIEVHFVR